MAALEVRIHDHMAAFEERVTRSVAMEIGRSTTLMMEHLNSLIRASNDETRAVSERARSTEARLDAYLADASVRRRPRRQRSSPTVSITRRPGCGRRELYQPAEPSHVVPAPCQPPGLSPASAVRMPGCE
jgi:hypothetical protein